MGLVPLIGLPTHHSKSVAFQTPASPIMEGIVDLHHDIMTFLAFIIVFVLYLLTVVVLNFNDEGDRNGIHGYGGDNIIHNTPIELI
jgi:cytochrome c oxidase subunit 2